MPSFSTVFRVDKVRKQLYRDVVVWQFVLNKFESHSFLYKKSYE